MCLFWALLITEPLKLAAIDIGSNAIRLQISTILEGGEKILFKKLEYVRFPLRLGHDVFTTNRLSEGSIAKFKKLMKAYKLLLELYEVDDYMFCATSAMRESENGEEVARQVKEELGIVINIIDGHLEAEFINKAIFSYLTQFSMSCHIMGLSWRSNIRTEPILNDRVLSFFPFTNKLSSVLPPPTSMCK